MRCKADPPRKVETAIFFGFPPNWKTSPPIPLSLKWKRGIKGGEVVAAGFSLRYVLNPEGCGYNFLFCQELLLTEASGQKT
jgi:hypothetical protein